MLPSMFADVLCMLRRSCLIRSFGFGVLMLTMSVVLAPQPAGAEAGDATVSIPAPVGFMPALLPKVLDAATQDESQLRLLPSDAGGFEQAATNGDTVGVQLVGQNVPQIQSGELLTTTTIASSTTSTVAGGNAAIPQLGGTDASGRTAFAFTDESGTPVAPPAGAEAGAATVSIPAPVGFMPAGAEAEAATVSIPAPVGYMPAAAAPEVVPDSSVAPMLRTAGFALVGVGLVLMASSQSQRASRRTGVVGARLTVSSAGPGHTGNRSLATR